jgi:hypothetical protein
MWNLGAWPWYGDESALRMALPLVEHDEWTLGRPRSAAYGKLRGLREDYADSERVFAWMAGAGANAARQMHNRLRNETEHDASIILNMPGLGGMASLFCTGVRIGSPSVVAVMLDYGGNANAICGDALGATSPALIYGAMRGVQMTRVLLDGGAELDGRGEGGENALTMAIMRNRLDVAGLLLERGLNPTKSSMSQIVGNWVEPESIRFAVAAGINVNGRGEGRAPLSRAAILGRVDLVQAGAARMWGAG